MDIEQINDTLAVYSEAYMCKIYLSLEPYYNDRWNLFLDGPESGDVVSVEGTLSEVFSALIEFYKSKSN